MIKRIFLVLAMLFAFVGSLEAQQKLNALTKPNSAFKKSFNANSFADSDKRFRDSNKTFNTSNYYDNGKSYYDQNKRFTTGSYYDQNKRPYGFDTSYNSPNAGNDYSTKSRFYDENKELFFDNSSRSLNKDYSGRADFSKKRNMEDMVDAVYEDLMDRSMSDINKYHSQTARGDDREGGIPIAPTTQQKESSILDLLDFSSKKIENTSMKFSLPKSMSHMRSSSLNKEISPQEMFDYSQIEAASKAQYPQNYPPKSARNPNIPDFSQASAPPTPKAQTPADGKQSYTIKKPINQDDAPKSIFGIPKEYNSGKLQITVEVKDKK